MRLELMFFALATGLLLIVPNVARATFLFPGETLVFTGTSVQTSPPVPGISTFGGSITLGSLIPGTLIWSVTAFGLTGCDLGIQSCESLVWTLMLQFDGLNDTAFGSASTLFTGNGGDSRRLTATFLDGNTSTNPYTDEDLTDPSSSRSGTFGYSLVSVPEPSYGLLVACTLGLAALWRRLVSPQKLRQGNGSWKL